MGHLIRDDEYDEGMEAMSFPRVVAEWDLDQFADLDLRVLMSLQDCHDCADSPDDMRDWLTRFAVANDLTVHPALFRPLAESPGVTPEKETP